jgi:hypothetical protein
MKRKTAFAIIALLALAGAATACGDDDDDSSTSCSGAACQALCEEQHADDLEECNEICALEAYCTADDECVCTFYPCDDDACAAWCQANTDLDGGACDPLNCECF